ncbi:MAG: DUF2789 domain-containing protein [Pseudomonadota bacterium]
MERTPPSMDALFDQLGLPSDPESIRRFIAEHGPLPNETRLHEAPFWNETQAKFLRDAFLEDADWIETVDRLNVQLHAPPVQSPGA